ncbi:MAG TPA: TPM domain-containing protein [Pyrinomonadaceae bacterium]
MSRNNRKSVVLKAFALACVLWAAAALARAETAQSPLPPPTGHVNDYANVIDAATKQRLETILENLKRVGQIEAAVVTVNTTGDQDIFDYTLAVARGWGIGAKDGDQAGLLLVVAINDRKYFTQVSRHIEGDLPDGLLAQIQREKLVPRFKEGRYAQGISDTMETYVATLAQSRGFSIEGIDQQRQTYRGPERSRGSAPQLSLSRMCLFGVILLFVILIFSRGGRGGRGGGGGCLNMLLLGSLLNSGGRSSGWGGGGFGGGGGGGGFGGFGGGGDFGGGGSGGSW